ncbi:hypothetical protein BD408DRAFT_448683 [Parasitella parasitica]|nr:hypothetical protein BD408DRAFT_448683 [Parasitella parasitica]
MVNVFHNFAYFPLQVAYKIIDMLIEQSSPTILSFLLQVKGPCDPYIWHFLGRTLSPRLWFDVAIIYNISILWKSKRLPHFSFVDANFGQDNSESTVRLSINRGTMWVITDHDMHHSADIVYEDIMGDRGLYIPENNRVAFLPLDEYTYFTYDDAKENMNILLEQSEKFHSNKFLLKKLET